MISPRLFFGAIVGLILLAWGAICARSHYTAKAMQHTAARDTLGKLVTHTDGVYVTDTLKLHRQLIIADTIRRRMVITDTISVRRVLTEDSLALRACVEVTSSCALTIKARDALIAELRHPVSPPRLTYPVEALYDPFAHASLVRAGAEFRLFAGVSAKAEGEFDQSRGFALRVGLRKVF